MRLGKILHFLMFAFAEHRGRVVGPVIRADQVGLALLVLPGLLVIAGEVLFGFGRLLRRVIVSTCAIRSFSTHHCTLFLLPVVLLIEVCFTKLFEVGALIVHGGSLLATSCHSYTSCSSWRVTSVRVVSSHLIWMICRIGERRDATNAKKESIF